MTIKKEIARNHLIFREHHVNDNIMFWPNLASCNYPRTTQDWLKQQNIPREDNSPNVLQARPIDNFSTLLSRKVYDGWWEGKMKKNCDEESTKRFESLTYLPSKG
jgi:hypothetical protein